MYYSQEKQSSRAVLELKERYKSPRATLALDTLIFK
jgi:hypothetical protein